MASVDPDIVTILSGHEPSDILILAPDCEKKMIYTVIVGGFLAYLNGIVIVKEKVLYLRFQKKCIRFYESLKYFWNNLKTS